MNETSVCVTQRTESRRELLARTMHHPNTNYVLVTDSVVIHNNYDGRVERLKRARAVCNCFAFLFLLLAAFLPMWVVNSVDGGGRILGVEYAVDFHIGSGMFFRNVCYGGSTPDEAFLTKLGLSCEGQSQTFDCTEESLDKDSEKYDVNCERFVATQFMAFVSLCVSLCLAACACCASLPIMDLVLHSLVFFSAISVMSLMKQSYMFKDENDFGCLRVFDSITLCHGYGVSVVMQSLGIATSVNALLLSAVIFIQTIIHRKTTSTTRQTTTYAVPAV